MSTVASTSLYRLAQWSIKFKSNVFLKPFLHQLMSKCCTETKPKPPNSKQCRCSRRTVCFCPPLGTLTSIQHLGVSWCSPSSIDSYSNYDNFQRMSSNLSELLQHELTFFPPNQGSENESSTESTSYS